MTARERECKALEDYPRPSLAVDTAVLTVTGGQLCVGVLSDPRSPKRRLPGTFLHEGETLADAVRRSMRVKAGIEGVEPIQLRVFDEPGRDTRGWVLSAAHVAVVRAASMGRLTPLTVAEATGLDFDHDAIVRFAVERLRLDYAGHPDPAGLLAKPFTIAELREVHEAVGGAPLQPDTFRRRVLPQLVDTGEVQRGGVGKPARLFRPG